VGCLVMGSVIINHGAPKIEQFDWGKESKVRGMHMLAYDTKLASTKTVPLTLTSVSPWRKLLGP